MKSRPILVTINTFICSSRIRYRHTIHQPLGTQHRWEKNGVKLPALSFTEACWGFQCLLLCYRADSQVSKAWSLNPMK